MALKKQDEAPLAWLQKAATLKTRREKMLKDLRKRLA